MRAIKSYSLPRGCCSFDKQTIASIITKLTSIRKELDVISYGRNQLYNWLLNGKVGSYMWSDIFWVYSFLLYIKAFIRINEKQFQQKQQKQIFYCIRIFVQSKVPDFGTNMSQSFNGFHGKIGETLFIYIKGEKCRGDWG